MPHFPRYTHFLVILIASFLTLKGASSAEHPMSIDHPHTPHLTHHNTTPLQNLPQNQQNKIEEQERIVNENEDIESEEYYYVDNMGLLKSFLFFCYMNWLFSDR